MPLIYNKFCIFNIITAWYTVIAIGWIHLARREQTKHALCHPNDCEGLWSPWVAAFTFVDFIDGEAAVEEAYSIPCNGPSL